MRRPHGALALLVIITSVAAQWSANLNLPISAGTYTAPGGVSSSGLRFWVDSSEGASLKHGSRLQLWFDKSGEGRHLTSVPFGVVPYATAVSLRPQVLFEDGAMAIGKPIALNVLTAFFVIRGGLDSGYHPLLARIDRASGFVVELKRLRAMNIGGSSVSGIFGSINSSGIVMIRLNGSASDYVSLNGGTEYIFSFNSAESATHVGAIYSFTGTRLLRASISEVLIWDRGLSASERTSVLRALGAKWGITVP
jgi:hypothetical protein